jgi:Arc/MetJ-type ribon-helix-helix transcriptional regulator
MKRYTVELGPKLDQELAELAEELGISRSEVIRRALVLFKHAVNAEEVILQAEDATQQRVRLKK